MSILEKRTAPRIRVARNADGTLSTASPVTQEEQFDNAFEQAVSSEFAPAAYESFAPEGLVDRAQIEEGSAGAVFDTSYQTALLGRMFDPISDMSLAEIERQNILAQNYTKDNFWKSMAIGMAGDFVSNAPIELGIMFTTAGVGNVLSGIGKTAKAGSALNRMSKGVDRIVDAYTTGKQGSRLSRLAIRGHTEFAAGALAAYLDETIRASNGTLVTSQALMERMAMEGTAGVMFGEIIRGALKAGSKLANIRQTVNEMLPEKARLTDKQLQDLIDQTDLNISRANVELDSLNRTLDQELDSLPPSLEEIIDQELNRPVEDAPDIQDVVDLEANRQNVSQSKEDLQGAQVVADQQARARQLAEEDRMRDLLGKTSEQKEGVSAEDSIPMSKETLESIPEFTGEGLPTNVFMARNNKGMAVLNPAFDGSIRDALDQIGQFKGNLRQTAGFKGLSILVRRLQELSDLDPTRRNQADLIMDLKMRRIKQGESTAGGFARSGTESTFDPATGRLVKTREHRPDADGEGAMIAIRSGLTIPQTIRVIAHELTHMMTVAEARVRISELENKLNINAPASVRGKIGATGGFVEMNNPKETRSFFTKAKLPKDDPLRNLNRIYEQAIKEGYAGEYGFTDILEFIAEVMSNSEFQRKLNGMKTTSSGIKRRSMLDKFIDVVGQLLGIKRTTVLTEAIKATDDLASDFVERGVKTDGPKAKSITGFDVDDSPLVPGEGPPVKTPAQKTPEELEIEAAIQRQEEKSEAVVDAALKSGDGGLDTGIGRITGPITKRVRNITERLTRAATTDNLKLINMFTMMGEAGRMLNREMVAGAELEAKISNVMQPFVEKSRDLFNAYRSELVKDREVTLNVATKFDKKQTGIEGQPTKLKMNGIQRLDLFMKIMDGVTKDGAFDETRLKHASSKDLYKANGGFELRGEKYSLTKEQVRAIQEDPRILVDSKELEIAESIWDGYRAAVPEANKISKKLAGVKVMDENNWYYSPKHLIGSNQVEGIDALTAISRRLQSNSTANVSGNLEARRQTGAFPHKLVNPISALQSYQYTVSTSMGNAEFAIRFDNFTRDRRVRKQLDELYGSNWRETLDSMRDYIGGDKSEVGRGTAIVSQLLSLRAQSILGYNPSVALKQIGSVMSAIATGKLPGESNVEMAKRALSLFKNTPEKMELINEMKEHSEFFRHRVDTGRINIDMNDIVENFGDFSSMADIPRRELQKTGVGKFILDKGGKINEARLKHIGDTMSWIRRFDEATLAAIWEAKKKSMFGDAGPQSKADWDNLNREFIEISMESQPTYNYGSRTLNQRKQGMVAKALTQFSSQTTDNFGLAHRGIMEYLNSPRDEADWNKMKARVLPLLIQNAYIAAVSVLYRVTTSGVRETLGGDENRRTRLEKKFPNWFQHYFVEYVNGVFGQIPGTGALAKQASSAVMGAPVYGTSIPLLEEFGGIMSGLSDRKLARAAKNALVFTGTPIAIPRTLGL